MAKSKKTSKKDHHDSKQNAWITKSMKLLLLIVSLAALVLSLVYMYTKDASKVCLANGNDDSSCGDAGKFFDNVDKK